MFRFRPAQRLLEANAFSAVFAHRRVLRSDPFELYYRPGAGPRARLGLVISKRHAKRAVHRNLVKRLAREVFRQCAASAFATDIVLRLGRPLAKTKLTGSVVKEQRAQWRAQLEQLFARVPHSGGAS